MYDARDSFQSGGATAEDSCLGHMGIDHVRTKDADQLSKAPKREKVMEGAYLSEHHRDVVAGDPLLAQPPGEKLIVHTGLPTSRGVGKMNVEAPTRQPGAQIDGEHLRSGVVKVGQDLQNPSAEHLICFERRQKWRPAPGRNTRSGWRFRR